MSAPKVAIPKPWRLTVAAILREGLPRKVFIRRRAAQDWRDLFPGAYEYELRDALAYVLEHNELCGKRHEMDEPGETYAFYFDHSGRRIYAKINLTAPDKVVIVYSAHRPLFDEGTDES
jgi:hypothetical protein